MPNSLILRYEILEFLLFINSKGWGIMSLDSQ